VGRVPVARRIRGERALRLLRRYMPRLGWCPRCGIPVLGMDRCPRCGGRVLEVRLAPPGDARPAWEPERRETFRAAVEELGKEAAERLLGGPWAFWLFNPVQAVDAADEVLVDGHTVAARLYDPLSGRWRVRPDRVGVEILVGEGIPPYAVVGEKLRPGALVSPRESRGVVWERGRWVALAGSGLSYGVGRVVAPWKLRVVKAWYRRRKVEWRHRPRSLSLGEAAEANRGWLEEREQEAVGWLREAMRSHPGRWMAGLSGGKDSTVSAAVAAEAGVEEAYTVDTGVEHPESLETVEEAARRLGLRLHRAEAGDAFWRGAEAYGPPARDYRWCTRLIKLAPLSRLFQEIEPSRRVVMVTGQRGAESPQRAASPRLAESGTIARGRGLVASPIQEWSSLEVFLYIALRGLPLNPLYRLGFERIGCYMCPASHLAEFRVVKRRRPELWGRWEDWLRRYARRAGLPGEWVDYGLWRWRLSYPAEVQALARRLGLEPGRLLRAAAGTVVETGEEYGRGGRCLVFSPRRLQPAPGSAEGWLRATGAEPSGSGDEAEARLPGGAVARIEKGRGVARICGDAEPGAARPVLQAAGAALLCLRCGLCMEACSYEAIPSPGVVDPLRCAGCRACLGVCPSSVLADLVLGPLGVGRRRGDRGGRRGAA
jgi:phosphoadenosine phosphosulfate reductase